MTGTWNWSGTLEQRSGVVSIPVNEHIPTIRMLHTGQNLGEKEAGLMIY